MTDELGLVAVDDKASRSNAQQVVYTSVTLQYTNQPTNQPRSASLAQG